jgi:hypothetical protein
MRLYLYIFLSGALVLGGLFILFGGPLHFQKIQIIGAPDAFVTELEKLLIQEILAKPAARVLGYRNLLSWPNGELKSQNPRLSGSLIQKDILGKTLKITLPEKKRSLIWCSEKCFWLDNSGYSIEEAPVTVGTLVPIVTSKSATLSLGLGHAVMSPQLFSNLLKTIGILESLGLSGLDMVVDTAGKELVVRRDGYAALYFNLQHDPENLISPLKKLMKLPGLKKLSYIDFRVENRAYYR